MGPLEAEVERIRDLDDRMQAQAEAPFAAWEAETQAIRDPEIAAAGEARQRETRKTLETLRDKGHKARLVTEPMLSNLQDINRALAVDKTAEGVEGVIPSIRRTLDMRGSALR
jgi:hypothetical protein